MRLTIAFALLRITWHAVEVVGFMHQPSPLARSNSQCSRASLGRKPLFSRLDGGDENEEDDEDTNLDLEAVRERLEALMGKNSDSGQSVKAEEKLLSEYPSTIRQKIIPNLVRKLHAKVLQSGNAPPTMTSAARERRLSEAALLFSLEKSDEAVPELWGLWFSEQGPGAASELLEAEEIASKGPLHWDKAEAMLWNLIQRHGIFWAEPVNRLATLMYLQGRLVESKMLCEIVLSVKPWHFGAISGVVMIHAALGDTVNARIWADRRLPPLQPTGSNERRLVWVQRALTDAAESLSASKSGSEGMFDTILGGNRESLEPDPKEKGPARVEARLDNFTRISQEFDDAWQ